MVVIVGVDWNRFQTKWMRTTANETPNPNAVNQSNVLNKLVARFLLKCNCHSFIIVQRCLYYTYFDILLFLNSLALWHKFFSPWNEDSSQKIPVVFAIALKSDRLCGCWISFACNGFTRIWRVTVAFLTLLTLDIFNVGIFVITGKKVFLVIESILSGSITSNHYHALIDTCAFWHLPLL